VSYKINVTPAALKELGNLPRDVQVRVGTKIGDLATTPRPSGVKKLKGVQNVYRVRVGDFRVVYTVDDGAQEVTITAVGDRKEIYDRGLG
jgi:mRNA interferase RelE/StbE